MVHVQTVTIFQTIIEEVQFYRGAATSEEWFNRRYGRTVLCI